VTRDPQEEAYEELLFIMAREGDKRAATRLVARWQPRLARTARRMLRDREQANEAVQEAWSGICRGWWQVSEPSLFPAWAFGVLHRKCVDQIRKISRERVHFSQDGAAPEPAVAADAPVRHDLEIAFATLSPEHRITALLYFSGGLTLSEVALATGVPIGTAKSRLYHARNQLKALLDGDLT
jgi:RNA polymerase sigma-70 factor (ECF subfamily)